MDMLLEGRRGSVAAGVTPARRGDAALRLTVRLDPRSVRRWHVDLLSRMARRPDLDVSVSFITGQDRPVPGLRALFAIEALLHPAPAGGLANPVPVAATSGFARCDGRPHLALDLTGTPGSGDRVWHVAFDGEAGEAALMRALLAGHLPVIEVRDGARVVAAGRIGTEYGGLVQASFEDVLARTSTLILAALSGTAFAPLPALPDAAPGGRRPTPSVATVAARQIVRAVPRAAYRALYRTPHWRTGWRRLDGPDVFDLRGHPATGWHDLPDDGHRFYADPFPIVRDGTLTLFVEDFAHRVGRGIISAVEFGPEGPLGTPRPVLEQPTHLSYPFVFAHDGQVWMIPESGGAGTVDLFRATAFPGGWVKEKTLLSGLVASDATLLRHGGLWWLFATVREGGGAFSDALHLWHAEDLFGPWTGHRGNPVLIDIASARPAGRIVRRGEALLRPVQDCRRGYGAALGIARITRLDPDGFEQVVEAILTAGPLWAGRRLHTLNQAGGFEFIDGSAFAPRWTRRSA